ncbi:MAG: membrane protein insertion efficiency factor YidD [Chlorobiaceae bacterium]
MMVWKYVNQLPILMIKLYQAFLSPLLGSSCRFVPTCSSYALEAFQHYNPLYASWLTLWRILRCNPFSKGGFDPLPLGLNNSSGKTNECCNG